MRLVVDATAWRDLDDIGVWIARDNVAAARRVLKSILQTIAQVQQFPGLARPGRVSGTRERIVAGTHYIVVFELWDNSSAIVVTAVVHAARHQ